MYMAHIAKAEKSHTTCSQFEMDIYPKANEVLGRAHFTDTLQCC